MTHNVFFFLLTNSFTGCRDRYPRVCNTPRYKSHCHDRGSASFAFVRIRCQKTCGACRWGEWITHKTKTTYSRTVALNIQPPPPPPPPPPRPLTHPGRIKSAVLGRNVRFGRDAHWFFFAFAEYHLYEKAARSSQGTGAHPLHHPLKSAPVIWRSSWR